LLDCTTTPLFIKAGNFSIFLLKLQII